MGFLEVMRERGLVAQLTFEEELVDHLSSGVRTAYAGFDPTAESLHVGHLMPIMVLQRWQQAGHRVIIVIGGGTGLVGDPTGKTELRQMLTAKDIESNIAALTPLFKKFIDLSTPEKGIIVNNASWLAPLEYLPFLRDFGRHFSVNRMLAAECFKNRLEKGLSFLEFNYMLLQSYDFYHLFKTQTCTMQVGGDDQWSNMLAGVDLVRRMSNATSTTKPNKAFCITTPLLATADGRKMGKTEKGAVWLNANQTSPFEYFQYWRNVDDSMVAPCMRYFTNLSPSVIEDHCAGAGVNINEAKKILAYECTRLLHGLEEAEKAKASASQLFGGGQGGEGAKDGGSEPKLTLDRRAFGGGMTIIDCLFAAGAVESKSEARRLIQQGGLAINGKKVENVNDMLTQGDLDRPGGCLVKKGKKHYYRLAFS